MKKNVVFVTGGGSGIGEESALLFAKSGADSVIIGDINLENAQSVAEKIKQLGVKAKAFYLDVSNPKSIENTFQQIVEEFGKIDTLVNSAGVSPLTPFNEVSIDEWDKVMNINARGAFLCCQKAIKIMAETNTKGSIINISSLASKVGGIITSAAYSCSKASVNTLTYAAAKYAAQFEIRVNCVSPGFIETSMTDIFPDDSKKKIFAGIPLPYFGQPQDIAEAVLFLASSKARFITGEILDVNGGSVMD